MSTGPRTPEGKAKSRANSIKHGLCSSVVAEDLELVQKRSDDCFNAMKPQDEYQAWAVAQVAVLTIRSERVVRMERRARDKASLRAELDWDGDRKLEAEITGGLLARRPRETVEALRQSPHGCEWLMAQWALLAHAADERKAWTDEQKSMAFDLLGTSQVFRVGREPGTVLDLYGNVVEEAGDPAAVARRMIDELEARRRVVAELDEVERSLTIADLSGDVGPELRRLRRYESAIYSRLRWLGEQVRAPIGGRKIVPWLRGNWTAQAEPAPAPDPKLPEEALAEYHDPDSCSPPFDLEPDEVPATGQKRDMPAITRNSKQKRIAKAEARQEAQRRRLDRLRG